MMVPNISDVSQLLNSNSKIKQIFFFVSFDLKFNSGRGNLNSIVIVFCLSKIVCKHKNISLLLLSRDFYIFAPLNSKINTKNYSNTIHKQKESGKAGKFKKKISSSLKKGHVISRL